MPDAIYQPLPFQEAIDFFRGKVNVPTRHWNDLWKGMHRRGFMVAGAIQEELLADFREAIDKALSEGTTLQDFQKTFDNVVARYGWTYNGTPGWRSAVIYDTNLFQSYNAGRYRQQTSPELLKLRPYLTYRHGDSVHPRPMHQSWDGITLPADDPWWDTHYPLNGWGCKCSVFSTSESDLERMGKSGPDMAPDNGTYLWKDPKGVEHEIPVGIDPGFDYNPGKMPYDYMGN
jgi:uncharacterized protein with gpF-like domain